MCIQNSLKTEAKSKQINQNLNCEMPEIPDWISKNFTQLEKESVLFPFPE